MNRTLIFGTLTFLILNIGCQNGKVHEERQDDHAMAETAEAPKAPVMLGVNMVPSGPIMQKHLGVNGEESTMIIAVAEDTPASGAGLELWDVVVSVNGSSEASPSALRTALRASNPGDVIELGVVRGTQAITIKVTLVEAEHDRMIPLPVGTDGT